MEENGAQPNTASSRLSITFVIAGVIAGVVSVPVLHGLNDRYRFEPTGQMASDAGAIAREQSARNNGDLMSSAVQGGLLGAVFGISFAVAACTHFGSMNRLAQSAAIAVIVGGVVGTFGRNGVRDFALHCISHDIRGLHVSGAIQGLIWAGAAAAVFVSIWSASGFASQGLMTGLASLVACAVASILIPVIGEFAFPEDYSDRVAEHLGLSALSAVVFGLVVGTGTAFAAKPEPSHSSV